MSGQPHQRVRRNVSPSTKQGPIKAVKAFSLKGSPTRKNSPTSSPTPIWTGILQRRSPENTRLSPDRRSPGSPSFKVERPKAVRVSPASSLRRTTSLDTINITGPYLKGQWATDIHAYHHYQHPQSGTFMIDKCTQTQDEWEVPSSSDRTDKKRRGGHRRSHSFGQDDQLAVALIRQRLQKSKEGSRQNESSKLRQSPVPGNHLALSTAPAASYIQSKAIGIPATHIPKTSMSRFQRNSVEGLNPEIEKLVLHTNYSGPEIEEDIFTKTQEIPDGHRAPVPEVNRGSSTRSIDTQTPSGCLDDNGSTGSRSQSVSPAIPIIPGHMDTSRPSSQSESGFDSVPKEHDKLEKGDQTDIVWEVPEENDKMEKEVESSDSPDLSVPKVSCAQSPKPNNSYSFVREPPDGCEKVTVIEEKTKVQPGPPIKEPLFYCPIQPSHIVFKPSRSSAFCPLYKSYMEKSQELNIKSQETQPPTGVEG